MFVIAPTDVPTAPALCSPDPAEVVLELRRVGHRYGEHWALEDVDLKVRRGEVVALLGPNGAGKSTLIHILLGLLRPTRGVAQILGIDASDRRARLAVGAMLQSAALPHTLRVAELLRWFASYYADPLALQECAMLAGIETLLGRRYDQLSGGQQRRVQFALALIGRPRFVFLDEPTAALDLHARRSFWTSFRALTERGLTVLLTTHLIDEAEAVASRVVMLRAGRVIAEGTPAELRARLDGTWIVLRTALSDAALTAMPGVVAVRHAGDRVRVRSTEPELCLRALLAADPTASAIEVAAARLEDVFDQLTGAAR